MNCLNDACQPSCEAPRAWALLFAEMTGSDLPDEVPADWLALAAARSGRADLTGLLLGDPDPEIGADERERADAEGDEVVDEAIRTLL